MTCEYQRILRTRLISFSHIARLENLSRKRAICLIHYHYCHLYLDQISSPTNSTRQSKHHNLQCRIQQRLPIFKLHKLIKVAIQMTLHRGHLPMSLARKHHDTTPGPVVPGSCQARSRQIPIPRIPLVGKGASTLGLLPRRIPYVSDQSNDFGAVLYSPSEFKEKLTTTRNLITIYGISRSRTNSSLHLESDPLE